MSTTSVSLLQSKAGKVLQARALQCSFSSVFHLRSAGMNQQQASFIETTFLIAVGIPISVMGIAGFYYTAVGGQQVSQQSQQQ